MKLEYKVLWFEDQFEQIEGDVERIKDYVRSFGFEPDFVHKDKISQPEIEALSARLDNYNPYDLIIFDYELGSGSETGLNIAHHLRNKIYTDMVFYSGRVPTELRELLYKAEVDGVFIVHRDDFYDDIERIIEDHIKRMSDINNVRGVVMSATSTMDLDLREIAAALIELDPDNIPSILEKLKTRLKKDHNSKLECADKMDCVKTAILDPYATTFENVRIILQDILSSNPELKALIAQNSVVHLVQQERNKLAHQKENLTDDGKMFLGMPGKQIEYNFDKFKDIRLSLLEARKNILHLKQN